MAPEALEIVIGARGFREDVDEKIAVIHEDPLSGIVAFNADRQFSCLFQAFFDVVADSVRLARVRNGANDEVVGEGSDFAQVQNFYIKGFPRFGPSGGDEPVGQVLNAGGLGVSGTARQTRLNVLLRLAYYSGGPAL